MADTPVVHIGENSPEHVAYELLLCIAKAENKSMKGMIGQEVANRKWLLDTYAECLSTVKSPEARLYKATSSGTPGYNIDDAD